MQVLRSRRIRSIQNVNPKFPATDGPVKIIDVDGGVSPKCSKSRIPVSVQKKEQMIQTIEQNTDLGESDEILTENSQTVSTILVF